MRCTVGRRTPGWSATRRTRSGRSRATTRAASAANGIPGGSMLMVVDDPEVENIFSTFLFDSLCGISDGMCRNLWKYGYLSVNIIKVSEIWIWWTSWKMDAICEIPCLLVNDCEISFSSFKIGAKIGRRNPFCIGTRVVVQSCWRPLKCKCCSPPTHGLHLAQNDLLKDFEEISKVIWF